MFRNKPLCPPRKPFSTASIGQLLQKSCEDLCIIAVGNRHAPAAVVVMVVAVVMVVVVVVMVVVVV